METSIAYTSGEHIIIRGRDLAGELMGAADYTDMMLLTSLGRMPSPGEKAVVNAIMVSLMDHGITPSSLAARLTYLGAPESFQSAVAAGLLGAGSTFLGGMQDVTVLLREAVAGLAGSADAPGSDASGSGASGSGAPALSDDAVREAADALVAARRAARLRMPGLGHNVHSTGDPRVAVLRRIVQQHDLYDVHWRLMDQLPAAFERATGKTLPMNNVGAVGASIAALGYPAQMGRGIALAARAGGLIAHLIEEAEKPLAKDVWEATLAELEPEEAS